MDYQSPRWEQTRLRVLRRDKWQCRECRRYGVLTDASVVHHVFPVADFPERQWDERNMIALCKACHNAMHVRGAGELSERGAAWQTRPPLTGR